MVTQIPDPKKSQHCAAWWMGSFKSDFSPSWTNIKKMIPHQRQSVLNIVRNFNGLFGLKKLPTESKIYKRPAIH